MIHTDIRKAHTLVSRRWYPIIKMQSHEYPKERNLHTASRNLSQSTLHNQYKVALVVHYWARTNGQFLNFIIVYE